MTDNNNNLPSVRDLPVPAAGTLENYIGFVNSIPILSEREEIDLATKWFEDEDVEAARYLVLSHLRLVVSIARGYLGYGLPLADIIQEGTIGLMKAVKRFDPRRKVRLVTFAIHWIRAEINEYVIKNWRIVKAITTKTQRKLFFNLRSLKEDIGNLSDAEARRIAKELNVSPSEVVDVNMRLTGADVNLISDDEDEVSPAHWLSDEEHTPEMMLEKKEQYQLQTTGLEAAISHLDSRSQDIVRSRWLLDPANQPTLHDMAHKYNVSAERIRQIEVKALEKMKAYLKDHTK